MRLNGDVRHDRTAWLELVTDGRDRDFLEHSVATLGKATVPAVGDRSCPGAANSHLRSLIEEHKRTGNGGEAPR